MFRRLEDNTTESIRCLPSRTVEEILLARIKELEDKLTTPKREGDKDDK